ncbi:hypothetical protein L3Q82_014984, partial [Scortum barcoo]
MQVLHGDAAVLRCRHQMSPPPQTTSRCQRASCRHGNLSERGSVAQMESAVRVLYGGGTSLNLSSKKLNSVPECVCGLTRLTALVLNNNSISRVPAALLSLRHELPAVLGHLESLKKLYLFGNQIAALPPEAIGGLVNLVVLNLNHNQIQRLPPEIKSLTKLRHLSVLDNKLEELPVELGHLTSLSEINVTSNSLSRLPQELYRCNELTKVHAARNKLTSLPEGIRALTKLQVLDVAGNKLSMFPVEFHLLSLKELHCEGNRFVRCEPMPSVQDAEVFSLKELAARLVLREDRNRSSLVHKTLPHYPFLPDCPAGQWQLLCALPGPLPHHLAGVRAFYQSE